MMTCSCTTCLLCEKVKKYSKKILPLTENGCSFVFNSSVNNDFEVVKLDSCRCSVSKPEKERCDYFVKVNDSLFVLLELKGSDIPKAAKQIVSSIDITKIANKPFKCFIVKKRGSVPKSSTTLQLAQAKIKKLGSTLEIHTGTCIFNI